jgi:hypothetical protein
MLWRLMRVGRLTDLDFANVPLPRARWSGIFWDIARFGNEPFFKSQAARLTAEQGDEREDD